MRIVAHMPVRNEFDIIEETVAEIFHWVDTLIVVDGQSTDGTYSLLCDLRHEWERNGKALFLISEADKDDKFTDCDIRTRLLQVTKEFEPDWVISVDADEIYQSYYDPNGNLVTPSTAIEAAEAAGANVVRCLVPQFWLTFSDLRRGALLEEDLVPSIQQRLRWYSWGHMGTFIWKWNDDHYYPEDEPKRTPELPGKTWRDWQIAGPLMPICKHYCIRSLEQGIKRTRERRERGGRRYFGKYFATSLVIDEQLAGLHYLGNDGQWCIEINHDRLGQYMGGKLGDPSTAHLVPKPLPEKEFA